MIGLQKHDPDISENIDFKRKHTLTVTILLDCLADEQAQQIEEVICVIVFSILFYLWDKTAFVPPIEHINVNRVLDSIKTV